MSFAHLSRQLIRRARGKPCGGRRYSMTKVRFSATTTLDLYMAGPNQTEKKPFGVDFEEGLHDWMFKQRYIREIFGIGEGGEEGPSNDVIREERSNIGVTIMGRNM